MKDNMFQPSSSGLTNRDTKAHEDYAPIWDKGTQGQHAHPPNSRLLTSPSLQASEEAFQRSENTCPSSLHVQHTELRTTYK